MRSTNFSEKVDHMVSPDGEKTPLWYDRAGWDFLATADFRNFLIPENLFLAWNNKWNGPFGSEAIFSSHLLYFGISNDINKMICKVILTMKTIEIPSSVVLKMKIFGRNHMNGSTSWKRNDMSSPVSNKLSTTVKKLSIRIR